MFQIYTDYTTTAQQKSDFLPAEDAEMDGYRASRDRRALTNPLNPVKTKLANLWHVLGRLRKVRIEVTVDVNESNLNGVIR